MAICAECGTGLFDGQFSCPVCSDRRDRARNLEDRKRRERQFAQEKLERDQIAQDEAKKKQEEKYPPPVVKDKEKGAALACVTSAPIGQIAHIA